MASAFSTYRLGLLSCFRKFLATENTPLSCCYAGVRLSSFYHIKHNRPNWTPPLRFDTVRLVIWPVKIVPEMTYYVSGGTLNPTHSLTRPNWWRVLVVTKTTTKKKINVLTAYQSQRVCCRDVLSAETNFWNEFVQYRSDPTESSRPAQREQRYTPDKKLRYRRDSVRRLHCVSKKTTLICYTL